MIQFEHTVDIGRPVSEVFDFLSDPRNFARWQTGVVQSTITSPGAIGVGTTFDETVRIMGWKVRTTCEITQYEADRKMCFKATSRPIAYAGQFTLEPGGNGTLLKVYGVGQLRGLWRLAEPLFGPEIKRESASEVQKIKELAESQPTVAAVE